MTLNREDSFALNDAASHGIMHYQNMADGTDDDGSRLRCKGRIEAIIRAAKKLQSRELQREYDNGLAERDGLTFTVMLNRDDSFHLYDAVSQATFDYQGIANRTEDEETRMRCVGRLAAIEHANQKINQAEIPLIEKEYQKGGLDVAN